MTKTRRDLVCRVLQIVRVTEIGESPTSEDAKTVDDYVDAVVWGLVKRRIIDPQATNEFSEELFPHIATCVAQECCVAFGRPRDPAGEKRAESLLRQL